MTEKQHGLTGKPSNNKKSENRKMSKIEMRVTPEQKAIWVRQANSESMKLAAWITKKLNS